MFPADILFQNIFSSASRTCYRDTENEYVVLIYLLFCGAIYCY